MESDFESVLSKVHRSVDEFLIVKQWLDTSELESLLTEGVIERFQWLLSNINEVAIAEQGLYVYCLMELLTMTITKQMARKERMDLCYKCIPIVREHLHVILNTDILGKLAKQTVQTFSTFVEAINLQAEGKSACIKHLLQQLIKISVEDRTAVLRDKLLWLLVKVLRGADHHQKLEIQTIIHNQLVSGLQLLHSFGNYRSQERFLEIIFRLHGRSAVDRFADCFSRYPKSVKERFHALWKESQFTEFRTFINALNSSHADARTVFSIHCSKAFLGDLQLVKPKRPLPSRFWVDFNLVSKSVFMMCSEKSFSNVDTEEEMDVLVRIENQDVRTVTCSDRTSEIIFHLNAPVKTNSEASKDIVKNACQVKLCFDGTQRFPGLVAFLPKMFGASLQHNTELNADSHLMSGKEAKQADVMNMDVSSTSSATETSFVSADSNTMNRSHLLTVHRDTNITLQCTLGPSDQNAHAAAGTRQTGFSHNEAYIAASLGKPACQLVGQAVYSEDFIKDVEELINQEMPSTANKSPMPEAAAAAASTNKIDTLATKGIEHVPTQDAVKKIQVETLPSNPVFGGSPTPLPFSDSSDSSGELMSIVHKNKSRKRVCKSSASSRAVTRSTKMMPPTIKKTYSEDELGDDSSWLPEQWLNSNKQSSRISERNITKRVSARTQKTIGLGRQKTIYELCDTDNEQEEPVFNRGRKKNETCKTRQPSKRSVHKHSQLIERAESASTSSGRKLSKAKTRERKQPSKPTRVKKQEKPMQIETESESDEEYPPLVVESVPSYSLPKTLLFVGGEQMPACTNDSIDQLGIGTSKSRSKISRKAVSQRKYGNAKSLSVKSSSKAKALPGYSDSEEENNTRARPAEFPGIQVPSDKTLCRTHTIGAGEHISPAKKVKTSEALASKNMAEIDSDLEYSENRLKNLASTVDKSLVQAVAKNPHEKCAPGVQRTNLTKNRHLNSKQSQIPRGLKKQSEHVVTEVQNQSGKELCPALVTEQEVSHDVQKSFSVMQAKKISSCVDVATVSRIESTQSRHSVINQSSEQDGKRTAKTQKQQSRIVESHVSKINRSLSPDNQLRCADNMDDDAECNELEMETSSRSHIENNSQRECVLILETLPVPNEYVLPVVEVETSCHQEPHEYDKMHKTNHKITLGTQQAERMRTSVTTNASGNSPLTKLTNKVNHNVSNTLEKWNTGGMISQGEHCTIVHSSPVKITSSSRLQANEGMELDHTCPSGTNSTLGKNQKMPTSESSTILLQNPQELERNPQHIIEGLPPPHDAGAVQETCIETVIDSFMEVLNKRMEEDKILYATLSRFCQERTNMREPK